MSGFPYPYTLVVSDGKSIRSLLPAQLGRAAPMIDAALRDLFLTPTPPTPDPAVLATVQTMTQGEMARAQGYTGDCCTTCGQFRMKQSGHCLVCDGCGTTTGCS